MSSPGNPRWAEWAVHWATACTASVLAAGYPRLSHCTGHAVTPATRHRANPRPALRIRSVGVHLPLVRTGEPVRHRGGATSRQLLVHGARDGPQRAFSPGARSARQDLHLSCLRVVGWRDRIRWQPLGYADMISPLFLPMLQGS